MKTASRAFPYSRSCGIQLEAVLYSHCYTFQHGHLRRRQSREQGTAGLMYYTSALSYSSDRTRINLCATQRAPLIFGTELGLNRSGNKQWDLCVGQVIKTRRSHSPTCSMITHTKKISSVCNRLKVFTLNSVGPYQSIY